MVMSLKGLSDITNCANPNHGSAIHKWPTFEIQTIDYCTSAPSSLQATISIV